MASSKQYFIKKMGKKTKKIIIILGPTASGKSDLAIKLALKLNSKKSQSKYQINGAEIISADSRQVYQGMDLGTGKITKKEMKGIPHHLLDIVSAKTRFSVTQYQKLATKTINKLIKENKIPLLCGGTGFYLQAITEGKIIPLVKPDWQLRKQLENKTIQELFKELKKIDPVRAKSIDRKNKRRLIRALEIIKKTDQAVPQLKSKKENYTSLLLGIKKEKNELNQLIKKRLSRRLKQGMIEEVRKLHESGISWQRLEEFGLEYRFVSQYLQKKINKKEMIFSLEKEIKNYAKRQMTWFNHQFNDPISQKTKIKWIKNYQEADQLVKNFLEKK